MTVVNGSRTAPPPPPVSDDLDEPRAGTAPGWIHGLPEDSRIALSALGHLLAGTHPEPPRETGVCFAERVLGVPRDTRLASESVPLSGVTSITYGLTLVEWLAEFSPEVEIGPYDSPAAPTWVSETLAEGEEPLRLPRRLSLGFPAGTIHTQAPVVIRVNARPAFGESRDIDITVRPGDQAIALDVLRRLEIRARELNPYKGRWLRAEMSGQGRLSLTIETAPTVTRADVVADENIWAELDLNARAVAGEHRRLADSGLHGSRGVLLVGPPGVGKSATAAALAGALHRGEYGGPGFTVMYVSARAGELGLTAVMRQARELAPGVVVVLEDIDIYIRSRNGGGGATHALSQLLQALDDAAGHRILTLMTSNDPRGLRDAAAIRNGRVDSLIEVGYPDRSAIEKLFDTFLRGLPDVDVDIPAVAAMIPPGKTSGADVREITRRAAIAAGDGPVTTVGLGAVIKAGRWRPQAPGGQGQGHYL